MRLSIRSWVTEWKGLPLLWLLSLEAEYDIGNINQEPKSMANHLMSQVLRELVQVSDEVVHKELGDRMEMVATTISSLEAE
ncbi:hypothetical protein Tco_0386960 [Tanacetum coccineum]